MKAPSIANTVVDEANRRTYVILAPRVLTDGEIYRVIRQEILRRGSPLADGETLTLTVACSDGRITSQVEPEQRKPQSPTAAAPNEAKGFTSPPASLE